MSDRKRCVSCDELVTDHDAPPYPDHHPTCVLAEAWNEKAGEITILSNQLSAARGEVERLTKERTDIANAMACEPDDHSDLVEATRLLVTERDEARAAYKKRVQHLDAGWAKDCAELARIQAICFDVRDRLIAMSLGAATRLAHDLNYACGEIDPGAAASATTDDVQGGTK